MESCPSSKDVWCPKWAAEPEGIRAMSLRAFQTVLVLGDSHCSHRNPGNSLVWGTDVPTSLV